MKKKTNFFNLANLITYGRTLMVFLILFLMYTDSTASKIAALILLIIIIPLDWIDGLVARKLKISSAFGGVVDVAGDRIVENVLWIGFAYLKLVPLWVPLIFITRSFVIDGIRSYALSKGKTTFAMMKSKLGLALVASRWARGLYGFAKSAAFILVMIAYLFKDILLLQNIAYGFVVFATAFCLVRGILTVYDSRTLFE